MSIPLQARWCACALVMALALWGCASSGSSGAAGSTRQDRNLITRADMEGMEELNAFQAIRRLKPNWLRYRGQSVLTSPDRESMRIYVNGSYFGDAESLSSLMVRNIREIRFMDSREATLRFGTDHTMGAIVVMTGGD